MTHDLSNRRHLTHFPKNNSKKLFSTDLLNQNSSSSSSTSILQLLSLPLQAGAPSPSAVHHPPLPLALCICSPHLDPRSLQLLSHLPLPRPLKFISIVLTILSHSLWQFIAPPLPTFHLRLHLLLTHQLLIRLGHRVPYLPPKFPYSAVPPEIRHAMSLFPTIDSDGL